MNISYANPRGYGTVQPDYLIVSVVATSLSSGVIASSRGEEESRETEKNEFKFRCDSEQSWGGREPRNREERAYLAGRAID